MKIGIIVIVIVVVIGAVYFLLMPRGPDVSQFEHLREPRITTMEDRRVVVVEARGDPNVVGPEAFGLLFKTYYKTKGVPKGRWQSAPRARWPVSLDAPKSDWIGFYAMPVPEGVTELPEVETAAGLKVSLTTWEYGDVAEILHVGPYTEEEPTIERLTDFIEEQGYQIVGPHEEEYIKGPTMMGKGDPEEYLTIIRYRVERADGV